MFNRQETVSQFIFGPEKVEPILGVLVLEALGYVVDPITKQLKKLSAKPLKQRLKVAVSKVIL